MRWMIGLIWVGSGCSGGSSDATGDTGTPPETEETPFECVTQSWDDLPGVLTGSVGGEEVIQITVPTTATWGFSTLGSNFDTELTLREDCQGYGTLGINDDWIGLDSYVETDLSAGDTIIALLSGYGGESGNFELHAFEVEDEESDCGDLLDTDGDGLLDCADESCADLPQCEVVCPANELMGDLPINVTTELQPGGPNAIIPSCGDVPSGAEQTFAFTAPESGTYAFNTQGSEFDTVIAVLDQCEGMELACNDDVGNRLFSRVTLELKAKQTVIVVVDSYDAFGLGDAVLNVVLTE
ncbi:MAG: hypothetical protein AAGA48_16265 [Myxococcota bacterium]